MKEHRDLRALIGSMTGSEKRYFKLNGGSGRFMQLFDAIVKGRDLPKTGKENRAVTAKYLTDSILDNLDAFNTKNSITAELAKQVRHGAVLYNKGLHKQALKVFLKAEKIAHQQQEFIQQQQIYWYMRSLLARGTEQSNGGLTMEAVLERNQQAAEEIMLISRLRFVQYAFQKTVTEMNSVSAETLHELKKLLSSEAMKQVNEKSGFFSQLTADNIISQYYLLSENFEAALHQGKKVFDLCCSHKKLLHDRGKLLVGSANNYMARCFKAKKFEEVKRVLDLLEAEKPNKESVEIMRLETYYSYLLIYLIATKQFDDTNLLPIIGKKLNEVGHRMNQAFLMLIYSHCSHYAFFRNDMSAALKWINLYLNHQNKDALAKLLSVAFDFRIIIYYEQNKLDLLENMMHLKQDKNSECNAFSQIRTAVRNFIASELSQGTQQTANLKMLREDLHKLKAAGKEDEGFDFFPFDEWVEWKMK